MSRPRKIRPGPTAEAHIRPGSSQQGYTVVGVTETGLYVDPTYRRFTRAELIRAAEDAGHPITDGALRDWQAKGFIADPSRVGLRGSAKGGSRKALWSENQRRLLLTLLEFRDHPERAGQDISGLGNLVIWMWAFYDGIVDNAQARKALTTWMNAQVGGTGGARSRIRIERLARAFLKPLVAPGVPKEKFNHTVQRLADLYWSNDQAGIVTFAEEIRSIMDPEATGRLVGPSLKPASPELIAKSLTAPLRAAHSLLTNARDITSRDWDFTRWYMREGWAAYSAEWPTLVATNDGTIDMRAPDLGHQVAAAASSALRILGVELLDRDELAGSA